MNTAKKPPRLVPQAVFFNILKIVANDMDREDRQTGARGPRSSPSKLNRSHHLPPVDNYAIARSYAAAARAAYEAEVARTISLASPKCSPARPVYDTTTTRRATSLSA